MDRSVTEEGPRFPESAADNPRERTWRFRVDRNSRGFWLAFCLLASAVAGYLMFHFGILQ